MIITLPSPLEHLMWQDESRCTQSTKHRACYLGSKEGTGGKKEENRVVQAMLVTEEEGKWWGMFFLFIYFFIFQLLFSLADIQAQEWPGCFSWQGRSFDFVVQQKLILMCHTRGKACLLSKIVAAFSRGEILDLGKGRCRSGQWVDALALIISFHDRFFDMMRPLHRILSRPIYAQS